MNQKDELKSLKSLVRKFLGEIRYVPMRAIDCDQIAVEELWGQLWDATKRRRKVAKK